MATGIILATVLEISIVVAVWGKNSFGDFGSKFGDWRTKVTDNGWGLNLTLDRGSGAGVRSMSSYLFAKLDVHIKLIPGRSAGTVTTFYLSTLGMGAQHEEIDFEFLGELSGPQYKLQTNVYIQGKGDKEERFNLWFDPTTAFHTYTVLWNRRNIIWSVDGFPIRQFKNYEAQGIPFPEAQPMWLYFTVWDGSDWATRGGKVKIDWSVGPFTACFRNFSSRVDRFSLAETLGRGGQTKLKFVRKKYMYYDYCTDIHRFPNGVLPQECIHAP